MILILLSLYVIGLVIMIHAIITAPTENTGDDMPGGIDDFVD